MERSNPIVIIIIFLVVCLSVTFYESERAINWESASAGKGNVFRNSVLDYALFSEKIKSGISYLKEYFAADSKFWNIMRESPVVVAVNGKASVVESLNLRSEDVAGPAEVEYGYDEKPAPQENPVDIQEAPVQETREVKGLEYQIKDIKNFDINNQLVPPYRVLIIGDSFMAVGGGLGDPLERSLLAYKDVEIKRLGVVSSGLASSRYYNWYTKTQELIDGFDPNVVIVMFGANDCGGQVSEAWKKDYSKKLNTFMSMLEKNDLTVFWVGLPIMKSESLSQGMSSINVLVEKEIPDHENFYFIPIWDILSDSNGKYLGSMKDESGKTKLLRTQDGVHLQYFAGTLVTKEIIKNMSEVMTLEKK